MGPVWLPPARSTVVVPGAGRLSGCDVSILSLVSSDPASARAGDLTRAEIAARCGYSAGSGTVKTSLARLRSLGLIRAGGPAAAGRGNWYGLTPAGSEALARARELFDGGGGDHGQEADRQAR